VKVSVILDKASVADCVRRLNRLGAAGDEAAKRAFGQVGTRVVARAKPLAPVDVVDGGDLRDSIRMLKPTKSSFGNIIMTVVAGGAPLKPSLGKRTKNIYAVIQHEDLTLHHDGGQAKFLEIPFLSEVQRAPGLLQAELDAEADRV
jgi:hypothetical protein